MTVSDRRITGPRPWAWFRSTSVGGLVGRAVLDGRALVLWRSRVRERRLAMATRLRETAYQEFAAVSAYAYALSLASEHLWTAPDQAITPEFLASHKKIADGLKDIAEGLTECSQVGLGELEVVLHQLERSRWRPRHPWPLTANHLRGHESSPRSTA
jgi:hypothetical protein